MDIKEFLKKEEDIIRGNEKEPSWTGQFKEFKGFKRRFGEFAWNCLKDCEEIESYFDQLSSNDNDKINLASIEEFSDHGEFINIHWEMAIACLGIKEIIKRLKEIEKEDKF